MRTTISLFLLALVLCAVALCWRPVETPLPTKERIAWLEAQLRETEPWARQIEQCSLQEQSTLRKAAR